LSVRRSATTIPALPSADFNTTVAFHQHLGFVEQSRYPGEFLIISHPAGIELHFWLNEKLEPTANDAGYYIRFESAAGSQLLYEQWTALDLETGSIGAQQGSGYNLLEYAVFDPHQNLLRGGGLIQS
jgi:hypothetical protein